MQKKSLSTKILRWNYAGLPLVGHGFYPLLGFDFLSAYHTEVADAILLKIIFRVDLFRFSFDISVTPAPVHRCCKVFQYFQTHKTAK